MYKYRYSPIQILPPPIRWLPSQVRPAVTSLLRIGGRQDLYGGVGSDLYAFRRGGGREGDAVRPVVAGFVWEGGSAFLWEGGSDLYSMYGRAQCT